MVNEMDRIIVVEGVDNLVDPVGDEEDMVDLVEAEGRAARDR